MQYSSSIKENKFIQLIPLSEENIMYHHFFKELDSIFIEAPIFNLSNDRTDDYNSQEIRQNMVIAAYCMDKNVFESIKHLFYAIVPENQIVLTSKMSKSFVKFQIFFKILIRFLKNEEGKMCVACDICLLNICYYFSLKINIINIKRKFCFLVDSSAFFVLNFLFLIHPFPIF
jgi:hypothetical protein